MDLTNFTKHLPDGLIQGRTWRYYNWSEHRAYINIINNKDIYFTQVDQILEDIRFYQSKHNLSLKEQEKWYLSEFSYPFISIDLRYYPK